MVDSLQDAVNDYFQTSADQSGQQANPLQSCFSDEVGGPYHNQDIFKCKPVTGLNQLQITDSKQKNETAKDNLKNQAAHQPETHAKPGNANKLPDLIKQAHQNGFTIKIVNGRYEYHHQVNGVDQIAFTTDGTKEGADKELHALVEKREAELTAKYGVQFSKAGDKTTVNDVAGDSHPAECRDPSLNELEALDAALSKNAFAPDGKKGPAFPKIYFLKPGEVQGFDALFEQDPSGQPAIFVCPAMLDLPTFQNDQLTKLTMEQRFSHELNHWARSWQDNPTNSAANIKPESAQTQDTSQGKPTPDTSVSAPPKQTDPTPEATPIDSPTPNGQSAPPADKATDPKDPKDQPDEEDQTATEKARYERLGWKEITSTHGDKEWVMQGTDNHLYACGESADGIRFWVRVDEQGVPIDKNGKRVIDPDSKDIEAAETAVIAKGVVYTDAGMFSTMKVKPINGYFPTPEEELSETEGFFHSKEGRKALAHDHWTLYQETKQLDQERINQVNGVGPDGKPLFIRNPDGIIVPNDEQHRAEVAAFEQKAKAQTTHH
jgi:hypothetical protein